MDLHTLKSHVIDSLTNLDATFAEARTREPALVPFATAREALAPWIRRGRVNEEHYPRIRALLREYQRPSKERASWSGTLLVVLFPMLVTLRRRLDVPDALASDLDTMLIAALYAEAARVNTHAKAAIMTVRRGVERSLYRSIRAHRQTLRGERLIASSFADVAVPDLELAIDLARDARRQSTQMQRVVRLRERDLPRVARSRNRARGDAELPASVRPPAPDRAVEL